MVDLRTPEKYDMDRSSVPVALSRFRDGQISGIGMFRICERPGIDVGPANIGYEGFSALGMMIALKLPESIVRTIIQHRTMRINAVCNKRGVPHSPIFHIISLQRRFKDARSKNLSETTARMILAHPDFTLDVKEKDRDGNTILDLVQMCAYEDIKQMIADLH